MKKFICFCMVMMLCACSATTSTHATQYETFSYVAKLTNPNIQKTSITIELNKPYTPEYMKSVSDIVVLASITRIDQADMKYNAVIGSTYGKLLIQKTLYGDAKEGEVLDFEKSGGVIKASVYEAAQPMQAQEKHKQVRKQNGIEISEHDYVEILIENDISIETQKTYLMYLKYSETMQKYEIIGLGNGLREVNVPTQTKVKSLALQIEDLKIKNNETGTFESLKDYIQTAIQ